MKWRWCLQKIHNVFTTTKIMNDFVVTSFAWMNEWMDSALWLWSMAVFVYSQHNTAATVAECMQSTDVNQIWVPVAMSPSIDRYAFNWRKYISNDKNIEENMRWWRQSDVIDFKSEKPIQTKLTVLRVTYDTIVCGPLYDVMAWNGHYCGLLATFGIHQ